MKALVITSLSGPDALAIQDASEPTLKSGQTLVRVAAGGLNFADFMTTQGGYPGTPPPPLIAGREFAGTEENAGHRVMGYIQWAAFAEKVAAQPHMLWPVPDHWTDEEAAAFPVNYFTAWQLVVVMGGLKRNETVLVHSAGGGVGIAATQIARHIGARVIGTASASKHAELRALGVDHLIDYRREDFEVRAREITNGRGVELILDAIGGDSLRKGYRLLAPTGRLGMFGISSAVAQKERRLLDMLAMLARTPWLQFNPMSLISANKGVFGVNLGHLWGEIDRIRVWGEQLLDLRAQGAIKPKIARSFTFDEAADAHHFIQDRKNIGKVLLVP